MEQDLQAIEYLMKTNSKNQDVLIELDKLLGISYWKTNQRIAAQTHLNQAYATNSSDVEVNFYLQEAYKAFKFQ